MAKLQNSLELLHPLFMPRVVDMLAEVRAAGFDPKVHETLRSFERAAELKLRGTGVEKSMHCYGLAVDVIDRSKKWNATPLFWATLGKAAKRQGLVWGGPWGDKPHVQAVPVRLQAQIRAAKTPAQIDKLVRSVLR